MLAKTVAEKNLFRVQTELDELRNLQSQGADSIHELNSRCESLATELAKRNERDAAVLAENQRLHQMIVSLEKEKSNFDLELKTWSQKYAHEKAAHDEDVTRFNAIKTDLLMSKEEANLAALNDAQSRLAAERDARQKAESKLLDMEKHVNSLAVDYAQLQQKEDTLNHELKAELDKARQLSVLYEMEQQKRSSIQTEFKTALQQIAQMKTAEKQLAKELSDVTNAKKALSDELRKLKDELNANEAQMKDMQDQLEAEGCFSTLYKTQVKELKEEIEEKSRQCSEFEMLQKTFEQERDMLTQQLALTAARLDAELVTHEVLEGQVADLEKEKTLVELELKDALNRHKAELGRRDQTISNLEDSYKTVSDEAEDLKNKKAG